MAVGVEFADIAGMKPAIDNRLGGLIGAPPVSLHHQIAPYEDLAVIGDPDLDAFERNAHRIDLVAPGRVAAHHRRRLGLAVPLQQANAQRRKERADFIVERRAARDQCLEPPAKAGLNLAAHEEIQNRVDKPVGDGQAFRRLVTLAPQRNGLFEQFLALAAGLPDAAPDAVVHRFVEARHGRHDGWFHLDHVLRQLVDPLRIVNLRADHDGEKQPAGMFVGMR